MAEEATHPINGCGGLVGCQKNLFYTFGGYNQTMEHWSGEDQDLTLRVVAGGNGYSFLRIPAEYVGYARNHSDGSRLFYQDQDNQELSREVLAQSTQFKSERAQAIKSSALQETLHALETPKPGLAPVANINKHGLLEFGCGNVTLYNAFYDADGKTVQFQEQALLLNSVIPPVGSLVAMTKQIQEETRNVRQSPQSRGDRGR